MGERQRLEFYRFNLYSHCEKKLMRPQLIKRCMILKVRYTSRHFQVNSVSTRIIVRVPYAADVSPVTLETVRLLETG